MKVGILTLFHSNRNWGGMLQGYALKTLLETRFSNLQADLLHYKSEKNIVYTSKFQQLQQYTPKDALQKVSAKLRSKANRTYKQRLTVRRERFLSFEKSLTTNPTVYTDEMLCDAAREYDCLICGSDQVWNPNVGKAGYLLAPISDECKKISYAASIARDDLSEHEKSVMLPLIERFDAISVREKTAKTILEQNIKSKTIHEVLDPVLMLTSSQWDTIAAQSELSFDGDYAVGFFFGKSAKKRARLEQYCQENGLTLKYIPYAKGEYIANEEKGTAEPIFDIGPCEFVHLLKHAHCVFTDSFHGAVFSILFEKPFCVFERSKKSKVSQNSRLYDLLEKFHLSDRMIQDTAMVDTVMKRSIDYTGVQTSLNEHRAASMQFLEQALATCHPKDTDKRVHVGELERWACTGCGLCAVKCPTQSIRMSYDTEGFSYPSVNADTCTDCTLCLYTCHEKNNMPTIGTRTVVGFHKDAAVRARSSSGGLFFALACAVLQKGGVVYGAVYADDFSVKHCRASNSAQLETLLTSKYVQSDITDIYVPIREDVKNGLPVLFAGTPCQCAAVRNYIGKNANSLFLVDFVCHGVPSPGVWQSYLHYLTDRSHKNITNVSFRDKAKGWHNYAMKIAFDKGLLRESHDENAYMRSFLSNKNIRKSCYRCAFKGKNSAADITLGDAWKVEREFPDWADDRGTSVAVIRTEKGAALFDQIAQSFSFRESSYAKWCRFNPSLVRPSTCPSGRTAFFNQYKTLTPGEFWHKNKKIPAKKKVRHIAKKIAQLLGIDNHLRKRM